MIPRRPLVLLSLLILLAAGPGWAEDGVLIVHVTYLGKKPIPGVRIGTTGDGSTVTTGVEGKARIRLAPGVKDGQEVALQVVPREGDKESWVFISPWDQRVLIPPFEGGQAVSVVLAKKGDKIALLGSIEGRKAIAQSIISSVGQRQQAKTKITDEQRRAVLQQQAAAYGLKPEDVDGALRTASQQSSDPYENGLTALYEKNYPVASERLEKALAASEKELTHVKDTLGDRAFFLGRSLYEQDRYQEAEIAFKRSAEFRGEHSETLTWLGLTLLSEAKYSEAATALGRAFEADPRTNSSLSIFIESNLLSYLSDHGDLKGAVRLEEDVLETRLRVLGVDHPDTLFAMATLAEKAQKLGYLAQARTLEEYTLEAMRRVLGADHPNTLIVMLNLATTLSAQGDLGEARKLEEYVFAARQRDQEAKDPDLVAMGNLAETLRAQGDLAGARKLQERVLETRRRVLGYDHPNTLTAMSNLAVTLKTQRDLVGARKLDEQVLEARRCVLGADHLDTITTMGNLAVILREQGDLSGAQVLEEEVFRIRQRVLGVEHRDTLTAMSNLAVTLRTQGNFGEARKLQEYILEIRRRILNPKHSDITISEWNLLQIRRALNDQAGSQELERSLSWLLAADEMTLSAAQKVIRQYLHESSSP